METHRTIDFQGHTIHYRKDGPDNKEIREKGDYKVVVFLHGYLQSLEVWSSYILTFMKTLRVIAIDLPGHGQSDCLGEVQTMEMMAEAVHAVLEHEQVKEHVIIGHSMGGYVALAYARKYFYCLRGIGLINSHCCADDPEKIEKRRKYCENIEANRPGFIIDFIDALFDSKKKLFMKQEIEDLTNESLQTTAQSAIATQIGMAQRVDQIEVLQKAEIPVLFVIGKQDPRIDVAFALSQAMEARHAEILLLGDVGHMAHLEEREYVKLRLYNFINTCYY